jgi:uncharacterized membrane protein YfcA
MLYSIIFLIITAASFVFAMLGLGGGMVYVPVLNWAGFDMVLVAIPLGLLLNGLNTAMVLIPFARKKLVDWKGGAVMAVAALIASPLGAMTSEHVPVQTLKIFFAAMVVIAVIIGSQLGGRYLTQKAKSKQVKVVYAVVLLLIAVKMIYEVIA